MVEKRSLIKGVDIKEFIRVCFSWILPATLFVILVNIVISLDNRPYLKDAIEQAVAPALWNVVGAIGFSLFALSILLWKKNNKATKMITNYASSILLVVFEIGLLQIGIVLGKFIIGFAYFDVLKWQHWFLGISIIILFPLFFFVNTLFWYCAKILKAKDAKDNILIKKLYNMKEWLRWPLSIFFFILFWISIVLNSIF